MRKKIIAGNWKMNKTNPEAVELALELVGHEGDEKKLRVVICPPYTALSEVSSAIADSGIFLGAQNMHSEESGAFTGEIAPDMLLTIGVTYVILGHSERREYFAESDRSINAKVRLAMEKGLIPIICVGERLEERENGKTEEVVGRQIDGALAGLDRDDIANVVIAYEPVWAIGTGRTASPEVAQETHGFIRDRLRKKYGETADEIPILYGGSMKSSNSAELLKQPDIDGGLIGGASLKADEFVKIINSA
jgi:triosephosphate isomerase